MKCVTAIKVVYEKEEKIVAFLDDFGKKISQAGQNTLQKTKDMADVAKINSQISDEEKRINDTYFQIGKQYVELHASDCEEAFKGMVQAIADAENKIKEYKEQIQDIKGIARCPKCGAEVAKGALFCSACGEKMPEQPVQEEVVAQVEEKKCSNCGAVIMEGALFCAECGTKVE